MELKELQTKVDQLKENASVKHDLYMRSTGAPASQFAWDSAEDADGVPILARKKSSDSDPNIKVSYDNFALIQNTKSGYLASDITRTYEDSVSDYVKELYSNFDRSNCIRSLYSKLMSACAGWGNTFTLCTISGDNDVIMTQIPAYSAYVEYDGMTSKPTSGLVVGLETVYFYDELNVTEYPYKDGKVSAGSSKKHGFGAVPLIEWVNNDQRRGNAQKAVTLIDAYDRCVSDNVTEYSTFRNAYILLKNMGVIDDKTKQDMQKTGVITVDGDGGAEFLTKDINPNFAELVLNTIWSGIWIVASSVDPKALSTLSNATAFQIGQMYRLMEQDSKLTESEWQMSLRRLDELLKSFWTTIATPSAQDYDTYDVNYTFRRTVPQDIVSELEGIKRAGGSLPQYFLFMRAMGISEERARQLAEEGMAEQDALLGGTFGGE